MRVRVQYAGRGGRRCEWIDVGGEEKKNMPNSNYRDRDQRDEPKAQPWDLIRIVPVVKGNKTEDEWVRCGVLWQMKEREGFSWTMYFAIPEGARMAAMPRQAKNGGDR